jgi:putative transferase (TIGR04331 family)
MKISKKNIRATSLKEFWGTEYADSLYLWEGAKHRLTLSEIEGVPEETLSDFFAAPKTIEAASEYCKQVYFKVLPRLARKLNEILGVSLPDTFWRTAFGYWLFRHICITYDKFECLAKIGIDQTSIKLLDKNSFYIPYNHYDYVNTFCNDFGVQQLVSHYYYLFKNSEFPIVSMKQNLTSKKRKRISDFGKKMTREVLKMASHVFRKIVSTVEPTIAMCGVCYTDDVATTLFSGSRGMIAPIRPPFVNVSRSVNMGKREKLLDIRFENNFERFLIHTLYYCLPQMFFEHFREYYVFFLKDIKSKKFSHIVSEYWISDIPSSIYVAIAQNEGRKFISYEHASGIVFEKACLYWIDRLASDECITVGWNVNDKKVIPGGFICRDIKPYQCTPEKVNIFYVSSTVHPYIMELDILNASSTVFMNALKRTRDFYDLLPELHRGHFVFRPRREDFFWDTEHSLEVKRKKIRIDSGDFSVGISNARIVVIDHLSTGVAEILLMRVPFLIVKDECHATPFVDELNAIFDELKCCGVMHTSAQSAVDHLKNIYDDVPLWWNGQPVQAVINKLITKTLAPASKTIDYLMSCSSAEGVVR